MPTKTRPRPAGHLDTRKKKAHVCDPPRIAIAELLNRDPRWQSARDEILRRQMLLAGAVFVRSARNEAGMTQVQLAEALGVSQSRVAQLESGADGQGSPPELLTLARVAQACGRQVKLQLV